jgi:hypothetical protein
MSSQQAFTDPDKAGASGCPALTSASAAAGRLCGPGQARIAKTRGKKRVLKGFDG